MKMADILRDLADLLDQKEGDQGQENPSQTALTQVDSELPGEAEPQGNEPTHTVMISPLQQKLELLKKSVNVDSAFDGEEDPLDRLRKTAGLNVTAQQISGEDHEAE